MIPILVFTTVFIFVEIQEGVFLSLSLRHSTVSTRELGRYVSP